MQVDQITADDSEFDGSDLRRHIYNPNEMNEPDLNLMSLFKPLADAAIEKAKGGDPMSSAENQQRGQQIREKYKNVFHSVKPVNHERFRQILLQKSFRHDSALDERKKSGMRFKQVESVINAVCHPKTVDNACELYLQQIRNENSKQNDAVTEEMNR